MKIRDQAAKKDTGKTRWELLPWVAIEAVAEVMTDALTDKPGKPGYEAHSWIRVEPSRYFAALHRHLMARLKGERNASDTGLPHLAHAVCNALFLLAFDLRGRPLDLQGTELHDTEPAPRPDLDPTSFSGRIQTTRIRDMGRLK